MANLQTYTTPDEVRAVLGVAKEELEDVTIELPVYVLQLQFDLADVNSGLEAAYLDIAAISPTVRTAVQQKLYDVTAVYSSYVVSRLLLTSVSIFSPQQITDGKAMQNRISDPFEEVRKGVEATYQSLRNRLLVALAAIGTNIAATTTRSYVTSSGLNLNPVTNV